MIVIVMIYCRSCNILDLCFCLREYFVIYVTTLCVVEIASYREAKRKCMTRDNMICMIPHGLKCYEHYNLLFSATAHMHTIAHGLGITCKAISTHELSFSLTREFV